MQIICGLWKNLWDSAYLFQTAREKSCDYLLINFIKKLRDSFKITLTGSVNTCIKSLRANIIYSNTANIDHHTSSQNNILLHIFKVCKLQKPAEQFMELFNLFELKILGYYLRVFRSFRELLLPPLILAELCLGAYQVQPSEAVSLGPPTPIWTN